jgi:hypothetical protein
MRYRKLPVEIDAIQFDGTESCADHICEEFDGVTKIFRNTGEFSRVMCETLEGRMLADVGDYIICGVEGEVYPCKESVFLKTYEVV